MRKGFLTSISFLALTALPCAALAEPPMLPSLVEQALGSNPEIAESQAQWDALTARVRRAGSWDDPMLMLGIQNGLVRDPLDFRAESMTSKVIGISQMVPYFGKRGLEKESAALDAEQSSRALQERRLQLSQMVRETWYQIYFIDRSSEVVDRTIATLDDLTRFTETMYGVGGALQQDVLKAQVERSKMEEMRIVLKQKRRSLEAAMNSLLVRPEETPLEVPAELRISPLAKGQDELMALALAHRPQLKALESAVEKARVGRKSADLEFFPDFTFSLEYMQREAAMESPGDDMYSASVSFNLPVRRERRHAMVAEADSEIRMGQAALEMERNNIRRDIADALARIERSRRLADLYREGVIPQATGALEAAMAAYRVGKVDFMNVLESQMSLFGFEREFHDAVADHQMQIARLQALTGVEEIASGQ